MAQPTVSTDQVTVLEGVVKRLRAQIPVLNETTCYVSGSNAPPPNAQQETVVTVWPTDGRFGEGEHEGGGKDHTVEYTGVSLVIWAKMYLDQVGKDVALLTEASRGILRLKHQIIKALSAHMLTNATGEDILINQIAPLTSGSPHSASEQAKGKTFLGDIELTFSTDFEYDLS